MKNIYDDKYAEPIFWYMKDHLEELGIYQLTHNERVSMAEYVYMFLYDDFVKWCDINYPNL